MTYRVFIKYCVFSKILIYFPDSVFSRCQCVYTRQAGRTPALQQNRQSSKILRKNTIFNEHPIVPQRTHLHWFSGTDQLILYLTLYIDHQVQFSSPFTALFLHSSRGSSDHLNPTFTILSKLISRYSSAHPSSYYPLISR